MRKRWICALLAAVMLMGMVCVTAVDVHAASALKASESCIALIKQLEGFQPTPKLDYSQYSVGYGSACEKGDYPDGITEAQADILLRADIADIVVTVNKFADKHGLSFTQQQFDALVSFTYNVGSNWMNDTEGMFRNAVVKKQTGNDFIFAITRWSTAGTGENKSVRLGLVERRLVEANLYLNGVYSHSVPANLTYVLYNTNIDAATNTIRIQGYDSTIGDTVKATPSKSGYRFLGWYTAAQGGKCVTSLDASLAGRTLYAHWQKGEGLDEKGNAVGVAANYTLYAAPDGSQAVRQQPSASAAEVKKLAANAEVTVVADYMDNNGVKWGKLSDGGWISLKEASEDIQPIQKLDKPVTVTVTRNGVNLRFGPGTKYDKVGTAYKGQQLTIVGVQEGGIYLWGKFDGGWICLDYTDYETAKLEGNPESNTVIAIGTVIKTSKLNVRSGPGTNYAIAGSLMGGATVQITQETKVGGTTWYKTKAGWVHSYYLQVTPVADGEVPKEEETTTPTQPDASEKPGTSGEQTKDEVIDTGTIFNCTNLRIRAGAGTNHAHIGDLARGTKVEIYGYAVVNGNVWGRIEQGWISMNYVQLDESLSEDGAVMATVANCTKVNIRSGAGTNYAKVGQLAAGTRVQVLQLMKLANGKIWARISQGWVHTDYLKLDETVSGDSGSADAGTSAPDSGNGDTAKPDSGNTDASKPDSGNTGIVVGTPSAVKLTGTIVKTDSLRVRSGPAVSYAHIGDIAKGTRVEILELTIANRTTWGRTAQGWISLYYVDLDKATSAEGVVTGTVVTDTLHVRSAAGVENKQVGNYYRGYKIVILEQTTVNGKVWGRTDLGWVCMDYVA
ncbi:MAG: SH3 domain-containing protein [Clostridia bacterium]|nr:SH3 domain-containing protein [Oscillospiraceae bacterium]MBP3588254.1 SH3 domain-containing protein [Clostridia bacterium]